MSEVKFTKGEWVCDIYSGAGQVDVVSSCGRKTLHRNKRHFGQSLTDEDVANAHLIASAPEMHEMLEKIATSMECFHGVNTDEIFSLLAKARGEHE